MKKFEVGKTYSSRCFNDHNLIESVEVIKRTEKTITVKSIYEPKPQCGNVNANYAGALPQPAQPN